MEFSLILQILNTVILVVLSLFLKSYLPSYFAKKGENKAAKEDTGEITGINEGVRSVYAEIKNTRDEYLRDQRNHLLKYYDFSVQFFYEKMAVNFSEMIIDDGKVLVDFQKSFHENVSELMKSYQRIVVYFEHDAEVRISAEKFLLLALEARKVMKKHFGKIKTTLIAETKLMSVVESHLEAYKQAVDKSIEADKEYWNAMAPVAEQAKEALVEYLTALNRFLQPSEIPNVPKGMFQR